MTDPSTDLHEPYSRDHTGSRHELVNSLIRKLAEVAAHKFIGIDGPWGSGKSWTVDKLIERIDEIAQPVKTEGSPYALIRAHQWELVDDPIDLVVGKLSKLQPDPTSEEVITNRENMLLTFRTAMNREPWSKFASELARQIIRDFEMAGIKPGSAISNAAGAVLENDKDHIKARLAAFDELESELEQFRKLLGRVTRIGKLQMRRCLIIDDLDRCRPEFARRLIERVSLVLGDQSPIVVFVFADRRSLEAHARHVFGEVQGAEGYYDKYVAEWIPLDPHPLQHQFSIHLEHWRMNWGHRLDSESLNECARITYSWSLTNRQLAEKVHPLLSRLIHTVDVPIEVRVWAICAHLLFPGGLRVLAESGFSFNSMPLPSTLGRRKSLTGGVSTEGGRIVNQFERGGSSDEEMQTFQNLLMVCESEMRG